MKNTGLIILLALLIPMGVWSQASQQATVNSQGGGEATGGTLTNFSVIGQPVQADNLTGGTVETGVGFMYAAEGTNVTSPVGQLLYDIPYNLEEVTEEYVFTVPVNNPASEAPNDLLFSPDGLTLYVAVTLGANVGEIRQYAMNVAFDLSAGMTLQGQFSEFTNEIRFNNDGTKLYRIDWNGLLYQYSLSTPYSIISGVTLDGTSAISYASRTGFVFNNDGSEMIMSEGTIGGRLYKYSLSQNFDITSTITQLESTGSAAGADIFINPSGTKVYSINNQNILEYSLDGPYDLWSGFRAASATAAVFSTAFNFSRGLHFSADGSTLFVSDWTDNSITQFSLLPPGFYEPETNDGSVAGAFRVYLEGDQFDNNAGSFISIDNLPQGLSPTIGATTNFINISLSGNAASSNVLDNISSLEFTFGDGAFVGGNAANILNATNHSSGFGIYFNEGPDNPPVFTSLSAVDFDENSTAVVLDVEANDGDGGAADVGITYSFNGGVDDGFFTIDSDDGELRFVAPPDFEDPLDDDGNNIYEVTVNADDGTGSTDQMIQVTVLDAAECAIPTNVTLDNVTEQTASLSWSTDAGVTYDYRYAVQGAQNFTEVLDQSISQVTLQGLSTGVDYTFELRTNCGDSQVSSWVTRNFGTVLAQCDAPSNFSIDNVSGTTVDLSWSGYQFADDYSIEYRVLGSNAWTTITGIDQTSYSLTGLLGLQTYQIRVISQCGNQVPGRSNVLTAQTGTGPNCGVPTITIGAISGTDVGLSWTSFGTATYEMQYRIYGTGMWTTESGLTAASRDFTGSELVALQTYQVRVRTLCPGGGAPTAWSSVMLFTTGGGANCGVPTISVDAISGTDVDLSWTSFGTATYEMQYRIYGSSVWTTESNLLTAGRSFTGTELLGLQTYQVRVRTQCPGGGVPSAWSSVTLFTTGGGTNCMIPVPGVDALGTTTADISWTSSTGATYNLLYREYGTTVWTTQTGVGTASIQLTGLTASTRYQFRVRANCGAGSLTPYSSVLNFTTDGAGGRTLDGQQDKETVTEQLDQQKQITLDIYPNPVTTDMLTIRLSKAVDQIEMTMHSMEGRLIIPQLNRMGESQYQINTTGLSNGVYVLNISYDGTREIRRVMIRK